MNTTTASQVVHIAVCACTYRRPQGLQQLLDGLARQQFTEQQAHLTIVIADNEASPATKEICEAFSHHSGTPLIYVPVTERGISQARNACLDHVPANADFIAFIDDDEIPVVDWLDQLLTMQGLTNADLVYGPVHPVFPPHAPPWLKESNWFHKPRQLACLQDGQEIGFAATCNCLLRHAVLNESGLRFDPAFGLSGGEDKLFFRQLKAQGYRIIWAEKALVRETVPAERACLKYLLSSEFRLGNVRLPVKLHLNTQKQSTLISKALYKSVTHLGIAMLEIITGLIKGQKGSTYLIKGTLKFAENTGIICSILGIKNKHYNK